jgi:hypothetical protein
VCVMCLEYIFAKKRKEKRKRKKWLGRFMEYRRRHRSLGIFELIREPIETFIETIATCCTRRLNVPISIAQ